MPEIACSAIYFLTLRGEVIISRVYRDDVGRKMADAFRTEILQSRELVGNPVRHLGACSFMYTRCNDIYILAVTKSNANCTMALKFINSVVSLLKSYFNSFCEDSIKDNFVLIYELLDEVMDFGYPQILTPEILKLYITQEGVKSEKKEKGKEVVDNKATLQVTGAVGHRREGIKYKKNEIYLDIVESVNLLMSAKGTVLRSDCSGRIVLKCFLSGMPDLRLGLNDKLGGDASRAPAASSSAASSKGGQKMIELDDVTFHQCVQLNRFHQDKTVSFIPPDGEFDLMKYRITEGIHLPFRVLPIIKEHGRTRLECNVKMKSTFGAKLFALGVVLRVPVPQYTAKATIQVSSGKAKYDAAHNCLIWKIRRFPGQQEMGLSAEIELVSTTVEKKPWSRPPIHLDFMVPMFTASGLRVRFLKVWEKAGYRTGKWVRYITKAGGDSGGLYEIRCS
mmetsp:Transcript_22706/g.27437  ORF Transcript_22706/g.27437 Transcript_22706/m.27437 type:complete len:450 (-) Transcript_22706:453-1802(-)|eukprot:CAMPEP_0197854474 /NCGR_PEP_ID=MMETSP1438-20131217/24755_1 /TAXON_ID=1461541 /ORGANISM="Pterosperma sp., Strain CCMP1384" /LENGTH=449 /DNA_ID=CAMNT_0043469233 /DNA_START=146 /DNA_END=1495 /DNA_ORIENTATION=+